MLKIHRRDEREGGRRSRGSGTRRENRNHDTGAVILQRLTKGNEDVVENADFDARCKSNTLFIVSGEQEQMVETKCFWLLSYIHYFIKRSPIM